MSAAEGERKRFHKPRRRTAVWGAVAGLFAVLVAGSSITTDNQVNGQTIIDCDKTPGQSGQTSISLIEGARLGGKKNLFGNISGGVDLSTGAGGSLDYHSGLGDNSAEISPDKGSNVFDGITVRADDSLRFTDGDTRFNVQPNKDADGYYSSAEVVIFCLNKPPQPNLTPTSTR